MVDYDEFTKAVTHHTMQHQKDMAEIKAEKKEIAMLIDQKTLLNRMNTELLIAVALIGVLLVGAFVALGVQSRQLAHARGTVDALNQRLAVTVDAADSSHALRVKDSDYVVETKDVTSFSTLLDLPNMPPDVLQVRRPACQSLPATHKLHVRARPACERGPNVSAIVAGNAVLASSKRPPPPPLPTPRPCPGLGAEHVEACL